MDDCLNLCLDSNPRSYVPNSDTPLTLDDACACRRILDRMFRVAGVPRTTIEALVQMGPVSMAALREMPKSNVSKVKLLKVKLSKVKLSKVKLLKVKLLKVKLLKVKLSKVKLPKVKLSKVKLSKVKLL
jgi:hypothetical protein